MVTHMSIDSLQPLEVGHVSDNLTHRVEIDCSAWKRKYPALTDYFLYITEPNGLIYIADTKVDGGKLIWDVSSGDTAIHGVGSYQVVAHGKYGDRRSSKTCALGIQANMDGMDKADPPGPSEAWVNKVYAARDAAQTAAKDAAKSAETMLHPPIIGENGNWWLWDAAAGEYLDSGFTSRGDVYVNNGTSYTLPTASETVKGGVKVGKGLAMEGESLNAEVTKEDIDELSEEKANKYVIEETDLPTVYYGGNLPQIKSDQIMPLRIVSKTMDVKGYCETKAQGNSSMNFPKKNQTTKLFADVACEEKLKLAFRNWGKQNKFCLKANWNDLSHARNVVSARIWGDMVRTRPDFDSIPELMRTSPNFGAIDGFPVRVFAAGTYQGRYAFNIPKDKWMANMDDENPNHCILCGEDYGSGCFRAPALIDGNDWTDEIHDTVPDNIKTRWNECITFVQASTDEEFKANLHQYFNVPSLIDYHIFGLVSCHLDGFGKNQLFMTYDGQVWYASVYDMDATWGNHYMGTKLVGADYARTAYEDYVSSASSGNGNLLYVRLEALFAEEIKERWNSVKTTALALDNILNNFEKWASICPPWIVAEDYAETTAEGAFVDMPGQDYNNIQQIRAFAKARHAWTETYINGEPTVNLWNIGERTCVLHPFSSTKDKVPNYEIGSNEFILSGARTGYISGNRNVEHTVTNNDLTFKVSESGVGLFMPVNITPGKTYRLRFTASDATGMMAVTWYDDTLKYIANTGALTPNNGLKYEGTFVAANYPNFVIAAAAAGTTLPETITFSDVSLVELL